MIYWHLTKRIVSSRVVDLNILSLGSSPSFSLECFWASHVTSLSLRCSSESINWSQRDVGRAGSLSTSQYSKKCYLKVNDYKLLILPCLIKNNLIIYSVKCAWHLATFSYFKYKNCQSSYVTCNLTGELSLAGFKILKKKTTMINFRWRKWCPYFAYGTKESLGEQLDTICSSYPAFEEWQTAPS